FPPEADERARQLLARPLAWNQIQERVRAHEILPLLCWNLKRLGFPGVPPAVEAELADAYRNNALRNALLAKELSRVLAMLGEEGVPVMPLKGTPLAESLFGDPALRVCADIDILVPTRYATHAFRLILSSGYEAPFTHPSLLDLPARYGKDCGLVAQYCPCGQPVPLP